MRNSGRIVGAVLLILAVSQTASAVEFDGGYTGPIEIKWTNWDFGHAYDPGQSAALPGGADALTVSGGLLQGLAPIPGGMPGEDGWFIFRVTTIQDLGANPVWQTDVTGASHGKELVGIGYGIHDVAVDTTTGTTYTFSDGMTIDIWEQDYGTFDMALGSSGRVGPDAYTGVGLPGGVAGATLILKAVVSPGMDVPAGSPVVPGVPGGTVYTLPGPQGTTHAYLEVIGGVWGNGILGDGELVAGPFLDPVSAASIDVAEGMLASRAAVYTPLAFNPHGAGVDDWAFRSQDPVSTTFAIPEPTTMTVLAMAMAGLLARRKRRR